jgi:hypothetical protein
MGAFVIEGISKTQSGVKWRMLWIWLAVSVALCWVCIGAQIDSFHPLAGHADHFRKLDFLPWISAFALSAIAAIVCIAQ